MHPHYCPIETSLLDKVMSFGSETSTYPGTVLTTRVYDTANRRSVIWSRQGQAGASPIHILTKLS